MRHGLPGPRHEEVLLRPTPAALRGYLSPGTGMTPVLAITLCGRGAERKSGIVLRRRWGGYLEVYHRPATRAPPRMAVRWIHRRFTVIPAKAGIQGYTEKPQFVAPDPGLRGNDSGGHKVGLINLPSPYSPATVSSSSILINERPVIADGRGRSINCRRVGARSARRPLVMLMAD